MTLVRRMAAETIGTALLLATVVGSGIMGERLAGGNVAIALLANSIATGAVLVALISTFASLSGAQFNPAVTLVETIRGAHVASFTTPESVHAAVIFVAVPATVTAEERRTLQLRAQHIRELALGKQGGPSFAELATQYSEDQVTQQQGGDLGWLDIGQEGSRYEPAVTGAIADLQDAGDISPLITTSGGIYVVKLLGRKATLARPVTEVRNGIRQQLMHSERQRRAAKFYADALAKVPVRVNEAGVAAMEAAEKAVLDVPHGGVPQSKG